MTTLTPIKADALATRLKSGQARLVDIREPDEFAREHIVGAVSLPLSQLERSGLSVEPERMVVFACRSGMRTNSNCARLAQLVDGDAFMLEGGLEAWKAAGLRVVANDKAPLEINRQVQIIVGALVLSGAVLALLVHPLFAAASGFFGAGLLFAGFSGWCGMARVLALAPWNQRRAV